MISIVTAYYNRKKLFIETLKSITKSQYKDFEVIAVDDASSSKERIEDLISKFPFLKVVRVEKENKWYHNSCIPFNMGLANASGDIIILQNPECLHVHDILSHVVETVNDSNYVSMSVYAINESLTKVLPMLNKKAFFECLPQRRCTDYNGWYNHSIHNPTHYHFCAALTRKNITALGGFDERFADGIAFEDNEFIDRVNRLGLNKIISDDISVIHQWHPRVFKLEIPEHLILWEINTALYEQTKGETICKVKNSYE